MKVEKMIVDKYLESIQSDESVFPIDSFPEKKKKREIVRTVYPENEDLIKKKRIMVDLDGTIHAYEKGWNNGKLGSVIKGAKEAIDELHNKGFEIIIFTTRASSEILHKKISKDKMVSDIEKWLDKNDIYYDDITSEKIEAVMYIDDRAIRFNGDWIETMKEVKKVSEYERWELK